MSRNDRLQLAQDVLAIEIEGLTAVKQALNGHFSDAIELLNQRAGKIVVVGIGKSGIVGRKLAATLTSTGNPAIFMHPSEGLHGDLGIVQRGDVVIVVSNSGTNAEIVDVLLPVQRLAVPIIALTSNLESDLAKSAAVVLNTSVPKEACPMGLAPTASTTAALALGDALAVVLLEEQGFTEEDYGYLHPGGALGKKLMRVGEIMHRDEDLPKVSKETPMPNVLIEMSLKRLGITAVVDRQGSLLGAISDGDVRRALEKNPNVLAHSAGDIMTPDPKIIRQDALAVAALEQMEKYEITVLFVVDETNQPVGAVHLHDLLKRKLT